MPKPSIPNMTDEQLRRLARILRLTAPVQTPEERKEADAVAAELEFRRAFKPNRHGEYA